MMAGGDRPQIVYSDLDGTLLGLGGCLFRDAGGEFTLAGARALALLAAAGAELAFVSGRSVRLLREDARVMGAGRYIAEAGCALVRDGVLYSNCDPFGHLEGKTVFEEIADTGAPRLLLNHFAGALAYHDPWYRDHEYTHLMRGHVDVGEVDRLLQENGHRDLKMVDNGVIEDQGYGMEVADLHAYHLLPSSAGKGSAIELDLTQSGLSARDAIACGDSDQDLEMAPAVRTLYLMSNARENGLHQPEGRLKEYGNVVIVGAEMVEGFLQAMEMEFGPDSSR
jgi:HAD superfamily hydrolase (TIGR01484 family)